MKKHTLILQRNQLLLASGILLIGLFQRELAGADGCPGSSFPATLVFQAGTNPVSVAVGDFNGDGNPDLAVADDGFVASDALQENGAVGVLLGLGSGTFQAAVICSNRRAPLLDATSVVQRYRCVEGLPMLLCLRSSPGRAGS